jgi:hypothetical protein
VTEDWKEARRSGAGRLIDERVARSLSRSSVSMEASGRRRVGATRLDPHVGGAVLVGAFDGDRGICFCCDGERRRAGRCVAGKAKRQP